MVSILNGVSELEENTQKPILYYGARNMADLVCKEYFDTIPGFNSDSQYIPIISEPESEAGWIGATGLVHEYLAQKLGDNCKESEYYIAGPPSYG